LLLRRSFSFVRHIDTFDFNKETQTMRAFQAVFMYYFMIDKMPSARTIYWLNRLALLFAFVLSLTCVPQMFYDQYVHGSDFLTCLLYAASGLAVSAFVAFCYWTTFWMFYGPVTKLYRLSVAVYRYFRN
jgi:hypothetical protein